MKTIRLFLENEDGATAIEYGLIATLVAVMIIGGLRSLGRETNAMYDQVSREVTRLPRP